MRKYVVFYDKRLGGSAPQRRSVTNLSLGASTSLFGTFPIIRALAQLVVAPPLAPEPEPEPPPTATHSDVPRPSMLSDLIAQVFCDRVRFDAARSHSTGREPEPDPTRRCERVRGGFTREFHRRGRSGL